jgi:peptidoglycan hydrolase-like protein with peptidoglycan-binding domain
MVVRDPKSGELMISQSRGGEGVELSSLDNYLERKQANGVKLYATDPLAEARTLLQDKRQDQVQGQTQASNQPAPRTAASDGVLKHGEKGEDIRHLQDTLNKLGYRDQQGRSLKEDGGFGDRTKEALQAYQRAHGLKADGIAGPQTLEALKKSEQAPLLSDPRHPDNAMFQQALKGMEKLGPQAFKSRQEMENAAGVAVFEAKASGLKQIDHVVLSSNGTGLFAMQGAPNDPAHHRVHLDKAQAAAEPIEKSTVQVQQETLPNAQMEREQQRSMKV